MTATDGMDIHLKQPSIAPAPPVSKRQRLASMMTTTGALRLLERLPQRRCLVVLNYHRIGCPGETQGDPNLYSATPAELEAQVRWLKERYHISTLDEAIAFVEGKEPFQGAGILLTFDD